MINVIFLLYMKILNIKWVFVEKIIFIEMIIWYVIKCIFKYSFGKRR